MSLYRIPCRARIPSTFYLGTSNAYRIFVFSSQLVQNKVTYLNCWARAFAALNGYYRVLGRGIWTVPTCFMNATPF